MGENVVNDEWFLLGCTWDSILGQLSGQELIKSNGQVTHSQYKSTKAFITSSLLYNSNNEEWSETNLKAIPTRESTS
jgi:hypothetical protein